VTVLGDPSVSGDAAPARPVVPGRVESIHLAPESGAPMTVVDRVRAVAGVGLEGDRYAERAGHWSPDPKVDRQLTLVAGEEIDRLAERFDIVLERGETRRNVTTRGVDVNALVGRRFRIGDVECLGVELCEPCTHLQSLTQPGVLNGLVHRAGLNADILSDGEIAIGDAVSVEE